MHPERPCTKCERWTGVYVGRKPFCKQCQDEVRWYSDEYLTYHSYQDYHDDYGDPVARVLPNGRLDPRTYEESFHEYRDAQARRKATEDQAEQDKLLLAKQERCRRADHRQCGECLMHGLVDADDYICIICRDGRSAVAPNHMQHWSHVPPDAAA